MFNFDHTLNGNNISVIHDLHKACLSDKNWSKKSITNLLKSDSISSILIQNDNTNIGFCIFQVAETDGEIISIGIIEGSRKSGFGNKILGETIKTLQQRGIENTFLEVAETNKEAISLYLSYGFKKSGIRKGYFTLKDGKKINAVIMKYVL